MFFINLFRRRWAIGLLNFDSDELTEFVYTRAFRRRRVESLLYWSQGCMVVDRWHRRADRLAF